MISNPLTEELIITTHKLFLGDRINNYGKSQFSFNGRRDSTGTYTQSKIEGDPSFPHINNANNPPHAGTTLT